MEFSGYPETNMALKPAAPGSKLQRQVTAIAVWKDHIRKQKLHLFRMIAKNSDCFGRILCLQHAVPCPAQNFVSHVPNKGLVFH